MFVITVAVRDCEKDCTIGPAHNAERARRADRGRLLSPYCQLAAGEADSRPYEAIQDAGTGQPESQFNFPFLNFTPAPLPFSSMNSTPAASRARCMA